MGGTQARGFENLCFQLADRAPGGWQTTKTGDPDGGVEWYHTSPGGDVLGFQCKFVWDIADLIAAAKSSFDTVAGNLAARNVSTLTFYAPFDLPDAADRNASGKLVKSARAKWNDAVNKWRKGLPDGARIEVRLETAGWILDRILEPGNEGRLKYFFDREHLGREWFETKLTHTVELADERYTPASNVNLVIGRDIEALRFAPRFAQTMTATKVAAHEAVTKMLALVNDGRTRAAYGPGIADVLDALDTLRSDGTVRARLLAPFAPSDITDIERLARVSQVLGDAIPRITEHSEPREREHGGATVSNRSNLLLDSVRNAEKAVSLLLRLNRSTAAAAAHSGSLLITGEAGQGKTHLLVDSSRRAMADGGLAICILGEVLDASRDILTQIAERLGLGSMAHHTFLEALSAAAQTTSSRLLISIDALNESASFDRWPSEFVGLVSALAEYPDLALVVSCRTDFTTLVLPPPPKRQALGVVERRHPGFLGRELEALEAYFKSVPNAWPKAPLLQPDFSNPLFVKLYAGGFAEVGQQPAAYDKHRSAVFDRFVESRVERINKALRLDPGQHRVEEALRAFEARLSGTGNSKLGYVEASDLFTSFVPERTEWPDTLFKKLMSEGVIGEAVLFVDHQQRSAVQFAYQALGDYRIASAALALHGAEIDAVRDGEVLLGVASGLRAWYAGAAQNLRLALVVLYPEATGHELLDGLFVDASATYDECLAAQSWAGHEDLRDLLAMTVETIPHRRPSSVTARTADLANLGQSRQSQPNLWDSAVAVTAEPGHLLNADRLHTKLLNLGRVQRDEFWIACTWHVLADDTSPLLRLIRWAEQTETPPWLKPGWSGTTRNGGADTEVVRLAATTLVWLLTSSNRFVRDRTTKALVQLLLGHGSVLVGLLQRFVLDDVRKIDDAYVTQRLITVAYGWAMRVGRADLVTMRTVADFMRDHVLGSGSTVNRQYPDVLARDAAQGIVDLASDLLPDFESSIQPPYSATRPQNPPTKEALEQRFDRDSKERSRSWASIFYSIFSHGDFGIYEIESAVRHIRRSSRASTVPVVDNQVDHVREGIESPAASDGTGADALRNAERLQYQEIIAALYGGSAGLQLGGSSPLEPAPQTVSGEWARRWVFQEVVRLGWTPERFVELESRLIREWDGRQGHKAERIGKKYQWMALFRLVAKLLDNHRYSEGNGATSDDYAGAWQLGMRDIDPSLPPAYFEPPSYYESDDGEWATLGLPARANGSTFTDAPATVWDIKPRSLPELAGADAWVLSDIDLPSLDERLIRQSPDGRRWVVLSEQVTHSGPSTTNSWDDGRAEEWTHIYGWLVKAGNTATLVKALEAQTLMGRWMPEGGDRTSSYLGEHGWSPSWRNVDAEDTGEPAARFGPEIAEPIGHRAPDDNSGIDDVLVLPASVGYLWEASTADCSIEETVSVTIPSAALLDTKTVHRHPDTADWYDGRQHIAANVRFDVGTTRGSVLVVDEVWLVSRLADEGWVLVTGMLGERRVLAPANKVWKQFDHIAHLDADGWKYGALRPKQVYAYGAVKAEGGNDDTYLATAAATE
ncbi:ATP-binding protein [Cryobacterium sp. TMT4-10]|uniref:ATP-binding protein n=1 Tax=Cryobacterium sp. TMT4-10 TaxID=1259256 RepID=UPI00106C83F9|nr:ATP-binding protein [Cryobacterium sp. TMT4-10]TFD20874.1 ATP-binding protein [Cryobacterium sp. TMT4-10]